MFLGSVPSAGLENRDGPRPLKVALRNARVFDGHQLGDPTTVVIDGGRIGTDAQGAEVFDAEGGTVIAGLIDAHIHVERREDLVRMAGFGVTTGLVMASWPRGQVNSLSNLPGLTDLRTAGIPAVGAGGNHAKMPDFPSEGIVTTPDEACRFVDARIEDGVDYIKIVTEGAPPEGMDLPTLKAVVRAAHDHSKNVIAHAVTSGAYAMALAAGVDIITHAPLDRSLDESLLARMATRGTVVVPTLTMMKASVRQIDLPFLDYAPAHHTVSALHRLGVPIVAGTDANASAGAPANVPHGEGMHQELELLVEAGLSPPAALRSATVLAARYFGLADRGLVAPGYRADLVLIDGDPMADITATRRIRRVWCAGVESVSA